MNLIATGFLILFLSAISPRDGFSAVAKSQVVSTGAGGEVQGTVTFTETDQGLDIKAEFEQAPQGEHGIHVHQYGLCSNQGKDAGDHFNPNDTPHGYLPEDGLEAAHAGDFGNIHIEANGTGSKQISVPGLSLHGENAIAGRSVILHAKKDAFTQPAGDAGDRIGCGVIAVSSSN